MIMLHIPHGLVGCHFQGMGEIISENCQPESLLQFVLTDGWPLVFGENSSLWWQITVFSMTVMQKSGVIFFPPNFILSMKAFHRDSSMQWKKSFYNILFIFTAWMSCLQCACTLCPLCPLCHYSKWLLHVCNFLPLLLIFFSSELWMVLSRHTSLPPDYRQKVFKRLVQLCILNHVSNHNILMPKQFSFWASYTSWNT